MKKEIEENILRSSSIIKESISLSSDIEEAVTIIVNCLKNGNKIILFGNGGSAADAQHIAAEFIGRFQKERKSYPAISLTSDSSVITSLSNDYSFDSIFSRQCESLVNVNDVVIGISTSGNSSNIIAAIKQAKYKGLKTISFTGKTGGKLNGLSDVTIYVPSENTQRIQEGHIMIGQIICGLIEDNFSN